MTRGKMAAREISAEASYIGPLLACILAWSGNIIMAIRYAGAELVEIYDVLYGESAPVTLVHLTVVRVFVVILSAVAIVFLLRKEFWVAQGRLSARAGLSINLFAIFLAMLVFMGQGVAYFIPLMGLKGRF